MARMTRSWAMRPRCTARSVASPPQPLGRALAALRTVRSGGHPWTDGEAEELLGRAGYGSVEHVPTAQVSLTLARRR